MFRKQYGEDPQVQLNQALQVQLSPQQLEDIRSRLDQARARERARATAKDLPEPEGS
jgi:hypothetical protein